MCEVFTDFKEREKLVLRRNELVVLLKDLEGQLEIADNPDRIEEILLTKAEAEDEIEEINEQLEEGV